MQCTQGHSIITETCQSCQAIQKKWYRKLSKTFDDIESTKYSDRPLISWSTSILANVTNDELEIIRERHDKMLDFGRTYEFKDQTEKKIWEFHCEELSNREIAKRLKFRKNNDTIRMIIKDLERELWL